VAVIPGAYDLGSVDALWLKPGTYARFLGIDLSLIYKQALLIVMPNGFGGFGLGGDGGTGEIATIAGAVAVLLAAGAVLRLALRWRRRGPPGPARPTAPPSGRRIRPRWAAPGMAAVCCLAIGTPALVVSLGRHSPPTPVRHSPGASVTTMPSAPPTLTWRAGQRPAPDFRLADQNGRPVLIAAYRGRPFIVTFIDPLCRNLCPLAAQVLDQADRQLPATRRLPIIAVSVDIYADTRPNLLLDYQKTAEHHRTRIGGRSPPGTRANRPRRRPGWLRRRGGAGR
jgi:cytochrome oxidase Cu insertion factor (SCO1/SenC/PrrC family)